MTTLDSKHFDAVVIGSGASGSIAVKELTERGLDVLLLEAGRDLTPEDFTPIPPSKPKAMSIDLIGRGKAALKGQYRQARRAMFQESKSKFLVNDAHSPYATDGADFLWIRGRIMGGRLNSYGRVLLRASDHEFKAASLDGIGIDWPISYADVEPWYERVERFLGIYGTSDNLPNLPDSVYRGPSPLTAAERKFKETVEGRWPERHVVPWRYAAPNPHRTPLGVVAAEATGRLTKRTDAVVSKITINPKTGRADGAVFIDRVAKTEHRVHADIVMLCASTIESVRLLLNSATDGHPNGLANSSGLVGRYFMDQTPSLLFGSAPEFPGAEVNDPAPADPYYAPVGGVYMPHFTNVDGPDGSDFARGWSVQGTIGRIPVPEGSGGTVGLMGFGEILPYYDNRISLHSWRKDAWGIPIPKIRLKITDNERALMRAQAKGLREMAEASGFKVNFVGTADGLGEGKIWPDADPISRLIFRVGFPMSLAMGAAIHECGGARMGSDPGDSVLNEFNQTWDVPNLYVTDSSCFTTNGAVGPTLTIMALTARAAEHAAQNA